MTRKVGFDFSWAAPVRAERQAGTLLEGMICTCSSKEETSAMIDSYSECLAPAYAGGILRWVRYESSTCRSLLDVFLP